MYILGEDTYFKSLTFCITKVNTPGTADGPGGRDQTLAVKSRKTAENSFFFRKKKKITPPIFFGIYLLVMPREFPRSGWNAEGVEEKERN